MVLLFPFYSTALSSVSAPHRGFYILLYCSADVCPRERVCTWFGNSWRYLELGWHTWNHYSELKYICEEAIWWLLVKLCLQSEIYTQGLGIPSVTIIPQSGTRYEALSSGENLSGHLCWSLLLWISFNFVGALEQGIQKYSIPVLMCLTCAG